LKGAAMRLSSWLSINTNSNTILPFVKRRKTMTDAVHLSTRAGSFLTGAPSWISIATLVEVGQTNVSTPITSLPTYGTWATLGIWTPVTVVDATGTSHTYSNADDYSAAFYQQASLNNIVRAVSERANPTQISIKTLPSSINGGNTNPRTSTFVADAGYNSNFGSAYNNQGNAIYIIDIATEKAYAWDATGNETNDYGYTLLGALNGVRVYDYNEVLSDYVENGVAKYDPFYGPMGGDYWNYIVTATVTTAGGANNNTILTETLTLPASLVA
jgi:hypothetical protein